MRPFLFVSFLTLQDGGNKKTKTLRKAHDEFIFVQLVQQYAAANNSGEGVGVIGANYVHYHCTGGNSQPSQFNNTPLNGKSQTNDTSNQQTSCVPTYSSGTSQQNSGIRQTYNLPNPGPQKVDASTMTEKETQTTSDGFFATGQQQECKSTYPITAMISSPATWQSLAGPPGSTVAEYISRLPASTLPLTLHHFLKFSSATVNESPVLQAPASVHRLERIFVCDICGAGLKRKEHLDRHKQGHNPERPYARSVCLKALKSNEHLSRHFVIHSGDKTQVCAECGKGFYRKDHLRKHSQSHIAKRLRAELVGQKPTPSAGNGNQ
ncbi:hypothetical protein C0J52_14353 [Blattella germanica]|nr:hypothetical protein C0J52_14353 [Blattella germanica]